MISYDTLLQKYEGIVQDKFKVRNPYLLKTGTLGTFINIMVNQELDLINYYNKLFQETHPALAQDFNSILFHSNFYGVPVEFSKPATFSIYFEVPKINTDDVYYYEYIIKENTEFVDNNGLNFIIPDKIQIVQDSGKIKANSYSNSNGKKELNIIENDTPNGKIYLIEYNNIQQYSRDFYVNNVTEYDLGESFFFDIPIQNYQNIYKIYSWVNLDPINNPVNIHGLKNYKIQTITDRFNLQKLNIKYFDFDSNKFDYNIFLDIKSTLLSFRTGNGIRGRHLPANSQIITEIRTTEGDKANNINIKANITSVDVKKVTLDKKESYFKSNLSLFSVTGGVAGQGFENIENIRSKIFAKIQTRNSLLTQADFEKAFTIYNRPFVDSKYLNNNPIVYIFNPLKYDNKTVETLSTNISEIDLAKDPFYPVWTPDPANGKEFISPFYFKRKNENIVDTYIVNPYIDIKLYTMQQYDLIKLAENDIELILKYDFVNRKSYLKLNNTKDNYTYKLTCNYFGHIFSFGENFEWEIDSIYTDKYCIVKKPLNNFKIDIYDENGNYVMSWYNKSVDNDFFQLEKKQEVFKYYQPQTDDLNITEDDLKETVAVEYLDNQLAEILSDVEQLYYPIQSNELPLLLRVPFVDKELFDEVDYNDFYMILDNYFRINNLKDQIPLTTRVQQSFYNTYDYNSDVFSDYKDYLFKSSSNDITTPKIPIILNISVDSEIFKLSNYNSTFDLEFDLKIKIIDFLLKKEGFQIEFFESELETLLINSYYNVDFNKSLLKNIDLLSPKKFIVNEPDNIYFNIKEKLGFEKLVSFVPPYFYFDYDNIKIETNLV